MLIVHGLDLSYFTGKLEGYLRARGLPYRLQEMDTGAFRRLALKTGVLQMPQLELPDGRWMTDTPVIIDQLEVIYSQSPVTPSAPALRFLAELIETYGDEHLWRPALYYRWGHAADARLLSERLGDGMMRDLPVPRTLRRLVALTRQKALYLKGEGVTEANRAFVEADYVDLLDALEPIFATRDWLLGSAPTRADIGLFGPMFRHFACDPTPSAMMRRRAPAVAAWVARLWALKPDPRRTAVAIARVPQDIGPLMALVGDRCLPEMAAHQAAVSQGVARIDHVEGQFRIACRANPYRASRLARLQAQYLALAAPARQIIDRLLGPCARATLRIVLSPEAGAQTGPATGSLRDRWGRTRAWPSSSPSMPIHHPRSEPS